MTTYKKVALTMLAMGLVAAVIFVFLDEFQTPKQSGDREVNFARSPESNAGTFDTPVSDKIVANVRAEREPSKFQRAGSAPPAVKAPSPPRKNLNAEKSLIVNVAGVETVSARSVAKLTKGEGFGKFMDQLSAEASTEPLALDLTEFFRGAAREANSAAENAVKMRVECGMSICGLSATAATNEVFDAWFASFVQNPGSQPYAMVRYDKVLGDGSIEHRLVFSNDPERSAVSHGN